MPPNTRTFRAAEGAAAGAAAAAGASMPRRPFNWRARALTSQQAFARARGAMLHRTDELLSFPWTEQELALSNLTAFGAAGNDTGVRSISSFALSDPRSRILHAKQTQVPDTSDSDIMTYDATLLQKSVTIGDVLRVARCLNAGAHLLQRSPTLLPPLHQAAASATPLLVLLLCFLGLDVDEEDQRGMTALGYAVQSGNAACVAALLMSGATIKELIPGTLSVRVCSCFSISF